MTDQRETRVGLTTETLEKALRRAFQLGQTYWQQADSEFISHHKKADETSAKFSALVTETLAVQSADASNAATGRGLTDARITDIADDTDSGRTSSGRRMFSDRNLLLFARAIESALLAAPAAPAPKLRVFYGPVPESNGRHNYTAILYRDNGNDFLDLVDGITIEQSEYPDRVRYEGDRVRYLLGELTERPDILDYDADKHSGYAAPAPAAQADDELPPLPHPQQNEWPQYSADQMRAYARSARQQSATPADRAPEKCNGCHSRCTNNPPDCYAIGGAWERKATPASAASEADKSGEVRA